jgi:hypothetical protein
MGNVQNTFIKSKMNKDLDDRLLSKGEYRDAQNVNVSKSEAADVGALENVLGNININSFTSEAGVVAVGNYMDEATNKIYVFLTNYTDTSGDSLSNPAPVSAYCAIGVYDVSSENSQILIKGNFLNFSTSHCVYGINMIEELLFWTDNRNQPRKININFAIAADANSVSPHYTTEDQISLAKYYPYNPPVLWDEITGITCSSAYASGVATVTITVGDAVALGVKAGMYIKLSGNNSAGDAQSQNLRVSRVVGATELEVESTVTADLTWNSQAITLYYPTSKNKTKEFLAPSIYGVVTAVTPSNTFTIDLDDGTVVFRQLQVGWEIISDRFPEGTKVQTSTPGAYPSTSYTIVADNNYIAATPLIVGDQILFAAPNDNYSSLWPGDGELLSDKFVRFAYRFKFEDGEYSLISPFTQPAFIPKQDGYITSLPGNIAKTGTTTNSVLLSQEEQMGTSTIVEFFENKTQEVVININTPEVVSTLVDTLKVSDIEILYKESDGLAIKVLDTISVTDADISGNLTTTFSYNYQSRKPIKTLTEAETVRVYDKIPVRAKTQSVTGNRVVFGNFYDKHSSPEKLDFYVGVSPKLQPFQANTNYSSVAYPNHTLKQNRSYQVGIVLQDKYGRSSDVILSSIGSSQVEWPSSSGEYYSGSTVYAPYKSVYSATPWSDEKLMNWFGDSLKVLFQNPIPTSIGSAPGYPGVYNSGTLSVTASNPTGPTVLDKFEITAWNYNISVGDIVKGTDSVGAAFSVSIIAVDIANNKFTISEDITLTPSSTVTIYGQANPLGYYSYKIVVKQTSQDYYNVYCPAPLAGTPTDVNSQTQQSIITLLADNINKVPADLTAVSPVQTQFRTSDEVLFPRVAGIKEELHSKQYYTGKKFFPVNTIGKLLDLGLDLTDSPITAPGIYTPESNPSLAVLNTSGTTYGNLNNSGVYGRPVIAPGHQITNPRNKWTETVGAISGGTGASGTINTTAITGSGSGLTVTGYASADLTLGEFDIVTVDAGTGYQAGDQVSVHINAAGSTQWTQPITFTLSQDDIDTLQRGLPVGVLEVKPADSALDIYWETSTSGLISTLNNTLQADNAAYQPFNVDFTAFPKGETFKYPESITRGTGIATISISNQSGTLLPASTVRLTKVVNGNGTLVTSSFGLTDLGGGSFKLSPNNNTYFKQDNNLQSWTYFVEADNVAFGLTYTNNFTFSGAMTNVTPSISLCPTTTTTNTGTATVTLQAVNGAVTDQAAKEIQWNQSDTSGNWSFLDTRAGDESAGTYNQQRITLTGVPNGTYTNDITVTDAGGSGLTSTACTVTVIVDMPTS